MDEYNKYIVSPEGTLLNKGMTLEEFKTIYSWEWGHRFLGRVIGLAFLLPIPYFAYKRKLSRKTGAYLAGIATLIGGQGALGWYMVKSGLTHEAIQARDGVPRVSQYRLAAHLGMAFLVYSLALRHALSIRRDWNMAKLGKGVGGLKNVSESLASLRTPQANKLRVLVTGLTGLVFLTAISGAFVAGLDAGLLYNTFPHMGDDLVPSVSELYSPKYSRKPDQSDLFIRNSLENPTTVQFDHRVLAITTFTAILALAAYVRRPSVAAHVPKTTLRWIKSTMHMAFLQVALGISTLVYLVPVPLAAAHQAGSLVLLSLCVGAGASLRMPGKAAQRWLAIAGRKPSPPSAAAAAASFRTAALREEPAAVLHAPSAPLTA